MYKFVRNISSQRPLNNKVALSGKRAFSSFDECGFEYNEFGHIRSDFASLVNSQSLLVMQNAANRLKELQALEPDNSNKTFEEVVASVRPRWCQSPKQMIEFQQYLLDNKIMDIENKVNDLKAKEAEDKAALESQAENTTE